MEATEPQLQRGSSVLRRRIERLLVFLVPLAAYVTIGCLLALHFHAYWGDAQSRLANAYYVFYSRDPHLSAIGFVWNPLTSLADMPLLLLKPLFPALASEGLAANLMSAIAMAGAGYQLFRFFEEMRIRPVARWGLLACFTLNPMILGFGANGMSEALFTFTLVVTARYLAKWLRDGGIRPLVVSAVFLGLAYLARNEAIAAAGAALVLVFIVTYWRAAGTRRVRRFAAVTDVVLFITPFVVAFAGWALASWVIVGHPFEQYSSAYGTASQLRLLGLNGPTASSKAAHFTYVVKAVWTMAPLLPILAVFAGRRAWRNHDLSILAVTAVVGGVCAFEVAAYTMGQIAWAYRYVIYTITFAVMLAACLASPADQRQVVGRRNGPYERPWLLVARRRSIDVRPAFASVAALLLLAPGVLGTGYTMLYSSIASQDQSVFNFALWPNSKAAHANPLRTQWASVVREASRLDALHLPHGAVMLDNFDPCVPQMILASSHPKQFSIPNDRDFSEKLGSPYQFGVRYFFAAPARGYTSVDAINVQFPSLYDNGAGIATLVDTIPLEGCPTYRLYKLLPQSS
jgi:hypothetical protein